MRQSLLVVSSLVVNMFVGAGCQMLKDVHVHSEANRKKAEASVGLLAKVDLDSVVEIGRTNINNLNQALLDATHHENSLKTRLEIHHVMSEKSAWSNRLEGASTSGEAVFDFLLNNKRFINLTDPECPEGIKGLKNQIVVSTNLSLISTLTNLLLIDTVKNLNRNQNELDRLGRTYERERNRLISGLGENVNLPALPKNPLEFPGKKSSAATSMTNILKSQAGYARDLRRASALMTRAEELLELDAKIRIGEALRDECVIELGATPLSSITDLQHELKSRENDIKELLKEFNKAKKELAQGEKVIKEAETRTDSEIAKKEKERLSAGLAEAQAKVSEIQQSLEETKTALAEASQEGDASDLESEVEKIKVSLRDAQKELNDLTAELSHLNEQSDSITARDIRKKLNNRLEAAKAALAKKKEEKGDPKDIKAAEAEVNMAEADLLAALTPSNDDIAVRYIKEYSETIETALTKISNIFERAKDLPLVGEEIKSEIVTAALTRIESIKEGEGNLAEVGRDILGILGRDPEVAHRLGLRGASVPSVNGLIIELAIHRLRYQQAALEFEFDRSKLALLKQVYDSYRDELAARFRLAGLIRDIDKAERDKLVNGTVASYLKKAETKNKELVIKSLIAYGMVISAENKRNLLRIEETALVRSASLDSADIALSTWKDFLTAPLNEIAAYHSGGIDVLKTLEAIGLGAIAVGVNN